MARISVLDHVLALMREADVRHQQRFDAQSEAIREARESVERRLQLLNEFRGALADQTATMATRAELDRTREDIKHLAARLDRIEGKSTGISAFWGVLIGVAVVAIGFIGLIVKIG